MWSSQAVLILLLLYSRLLVLFPWSVDGRQYYFSALSTSNNTMSLLSSLHFSALSLSGCTIVMLWFSQCHVCVVLTSDCAISLLYSCPISLWCDKVWCFLLWLNRYRIRVTDGHRYVPFVVVTLSSSVMTYHLIPPKVTRRYPLVEQDLLTIEEAPECPPQFLVSSCILVFSVLCSVL